MAKDETMGAGTGATSEEIAEELRELRTMTTALAQRLAQLGRKHLDETEDQLEEVTERLAAEGRQALNDLQHRLTHVEKTVERSVRDHPAPWLAGLLGVIGFGLVLGLVLRRHD